METSRICQDENGTWHWVYSLPMFKNFAILRTLVKAMVICCLPVFGLVFYLSVRGSGFSTYTLYAGGIVLACVAGALLLSVICYFFVAKLYGGMYVHIFSMDENSITTSQPIGQANKSAAIGMFAAAAGTVSNKPGLVMASVTAGSSVIVSTKFDDIITLKIDRKGGEIRVHSFLTWYSIFVNAEDFDFVAEFMSVRCKKARISYI